MLASPVHPELKDAGTQPSTNSVLVASECPLSSNGSVESIVKAESIPEQQGDFAKKTSCVDTENRLARQLQTLIFKLKKDVHLCANGYFFIFLVGMLCYLTDLSSLLCFLSIILISEFSFMNFVRWFILKVFLVNSKNRNKKVTCEKSKCLIFYENFSLKRSFI